MDNKSEWNHLQNQHRIMFDMIGPLIFVQMRFNGFQRKIGQSFSFYKLINNFQPSINKKHFKKLAMINHKIFASLIKWKQDVFRLLYKSLELYLLQQICKNVSIFIIFIASLYVYISLNNACWYSFCYFMNDFYIFTFIFYFVMLNQTLFLFGMFVY